MLTLNKNLFKKKHQINKFNKKNQSNNSTFKKKRSRKKYFISPYH